MNSNTNPPASSTSAPCPRCGSTLSSQGLCPKCLMAQAAMPTEDATQPAAPTTLPSVEAIAAAFPELEILEIIGRGGMGVVYKARQKSLNRLVALKLLAPERVRQPLFAERFAREAQALAALNHPNIVTVHDFGQTGEFYYLLMEFVDGVNLRQAMSAGRFTPEQALAIVPPVCEALHYAHDHGIVHRDIKPENLLLDKEGRVKIADFGIAKMLGAEAAETVSQPVGTPRYMAPEQGGSELRVDHRADIYSLGVVLYELLTGELPGSKLEPPSHRVQIDVRLDAVVLRALNEKPELRWQTAVEFQTQVATIADASSSGPLPPATTWLDIVDRGDYGASWTSAAEVFRGMVTQAEWIAKCDQVRRRLGALVSRQHRSTSNLTARRTEIKFDSEFEGIASAVETVTLIRDKQDQWRIVGYLIRPSGCKETDDPQQKLYHAMGYHTLWGQRLLKLSFVGFLGFLGFVPGWEWMRVFTVFLVFMAVGGFMEWLHRQRHPELAAPRRSLWHKTVTTIAIAALIVIPVRAWVAEAFVVDGKSVEPEIPRGSKMIVWKLSKTFVPGDIMAYHHGDQVWVARVKQVNDDSLTMQRNQTPEEVLPLKEVIGKVVSVYWRAPAPPSKLASAPAPGQPLAQTSSQPSAKPAAQAGVHLPANASPTAARLIAQMRAKLVDLRTKLGPQHPETLQLQTSIERIEQAVALSEPPAVSEAEDTSDRLRQAKVQPVKFVTEKPDFRPGDSIAIDSVEATSPAIGRGDIVVVKGRWQLRSENAATISISLSSFGNGGIGKTLPEHYQKISKGSGTFDLRTSINYVGRLHVHFVLPNGGGSFADQYFGAPAKPEAMPASPAIPSEPSLKTQIQSAFDAIKATVKGMASGKRYELPVLRGPEAGLPDDFLRRRSGQQVFESGLSCGCGDYALAFIHLLSSAGVEMLLVDGPEISLRSLEHHFSWHVVVAVRHPGDTTWILADPTQRGIISDAWSPDSKSFYGDRFWIGYAGPLDQYPVKSGEELKDFLGQTLAKVSPAVFNRQIFRFHFTVDKSLYGPDGKCLNPRAESLQQIQDSLLEKYKIQPERAIEMRLVKGGDDALGATSYSKERGWECTVGLQSGCSSSFIDYMNTRIRALEKSDAAK